MKGISIFFRAALLLALLPVHSWAGGTVAHGSGSAPALYTKGRASLQLASGALFSLTNLPEESIALNYAQTNIRFGWMLGTPGSGRGPLRGNWEGLAEITNSFIFKGPGTYMGGITLLFRYNFVQPDWPVVPYAQGGAGVIYNNVYGDKGQNNIGQAIEFTPQCSIGLNYLINRNWAVGVEAMFHHISNANMAPRNNSINSLGGFLGVTYFFDRILR